MLFKLVQLHPANKPSGIVWVEFDHEDVGKKTRLGNGHLYIQGIERSWAPIKPVTAQFSVGCNKAVQPNKKGVSTETSRCKNNTQKSAKYYV